MCVHYKSIFSDGPYISKAYPMACLCLWQISPMLSLTIVQDEHLIGFYAFDFDRGRCTDSRLEKLRGKAWSIPWDTIALESWGGQCGVVFLWYVCVVGVQATWAHCHQVFTFIPQSNSSRYIRYSCTYTRLSHVFVAVRYFSGLRRTFVYTAIIPVCVVVWSCSHSDVVIGRWIGCIGQLIQSSTQYWPWLMHAFV